MSGAFVAMTEGTEPEEIGRSSAFRLRRGSSSPLETGEVTAYLEAFVAELEASGWERIEDGTADGHSPRFRRAVTPLHHRISAYMPEADTEAFPWAHSREDEHTEPVAEIWQTARSRPSRLPSSLRPLPWTNRFPPKASTLWMLRPPRRKTKARPATAKRLDTERLEAERLEAERLQADRLEAERLEAERLKAERLEGGTGARRNGPRSGKTGSRAARGRAARGGTARGGTARSSASRGRAARTERLETERLETERRDVIAHVSETSALANRIGSYSGASALGRHPVVAAAAAAVVPVRSRGRSR